MLPATCPAGHARVLAGLESESRQLELAHQCVLHEYSVRKLEEMAKARPETEPVKAAAAKPLTPELHTLQNALREALGVKTTLNGTEKKERLHFPITVPRNWNTCTR